MPFQACSCTHVFSRNSQRKPDADYETEENIPTGNDSASLSITEAIDAIRKEDFDSSIEQFTKITKQTPSYHVACLRLGHAKREKAVRLPSDQNEEAIRLLNEAVDDFKKATGHVSKDYKATAYYERSKAFYQLYKKNNQDREYLEKAAEDALRSCDLSSDPKYSSWLEFLDERLKGMR